MLPTVNQVCLWYKDVITTPVIRELSHDWRRPLHHKWATVKSSAQLACYSHWILEGNNQTNPRLYIDLACFLLLEKEKYFCFTSNSPLRQRVSGTASLYRMWAVFVHVKVRELLPMKCSSNLWASAKELISVTCETSVEVSRSVCLKGGMLVQITKGSFREQRHLIIDCSLR